MNCKKTESIIIGIVLIFAIISIVINISSADLVGQAYRVENVDEFRAPRPSMNLYPSQGSSGDEITIEGNYFPKFSYWPIRPPYPVYTLMIDDEVIKTFTKPSSGKFKEKFIIPSVEPGEYRITIKEEPTVWDILKIKESPEYWEKTYGGSGFDEALSLNKLNNQNYLISGYTSSQGAGGTDCWVLEINGNGNVVWEKTYGGPEDDFCYDAIQTLNGDYILTGRTDSFGSGDFDIFIVKLNSERKIIWEKTYGGENYEICNQIKEIENNHLIIIGATTTNTMGGQDALVVEFDEIGNVVWEKTYGGNYYDIIEEFIELEDGYILTGWRNQKEIEESLFWAFRIDKEGNVIWDNLYGGINFDGAYSIDYFNNQYIISGRTDNFGENAPNVWTIKINENGDIIWNMSYDFGKFDQANSIKQTTDGGAIIAGYSNSFGSSPSNFLIIKIDQEGNVVWEKTYGGRGYDFGEKIIEIKAGEYLVVGDTTSYGAGYSDILLIKFKEPE